LGVKSLILAQSERWRQA